MAKYLKIPIQAETYAEAEMILQKYLNARGYKPLENKVEVDTADNDESTYIFLVEIIDGYETK